MLGAQRRVEARIGELLKKGKTGPKGFRHHDDEIKHNQTRDDFRILSHALNGCTLTDEEWRKSRRALVALLRQRLGLIPPL
jgi:hypothetical protein